MASIKILLAFLVVSTTSLLPYNLYMNAHEYFFYKLRNVSTDTNLSSGLLYDPIQRTHYQHVFEGWVALSCGFFCILGGILNVLFTHRMSNSFRVLCGHVTVLLAFMPTLILTYIDTDKHQIIFFWSSMGLASVASFGSMGLIGGGILGLAATFPVLYMQSVMLGQAVAGVFSSTLSIVCQLLASDAIINGQIYFSIASVWTLISIFAYLVLINSSLSGAVQLRVNSVMDNRPLLLDSEDEGNERQVDSLTSFEPKDTVPWKIVVNQASLELICALLVLIVTLSGFPAVASIVVSESKNDVWQDYFSAICCFLVFNLGDAAGRLIAKGMNLNRRILFGLSVSRIVFIPLIIFCNVSPRYHTPTLLPFDGAFIIIIMLFAISNGCLLTVASVNASGRVDDDMKEVAGSVFSLVCAAAALIGSAIGVLVVGSL